MIGYHYTTISRWERIKVKGLIPYKINPDNLKEYFPNGVNGIWIWQKKFIGVSHIGSILYQMAMKSELKIVYLKVNFRREDILDYNGDDIDLCHSGVIGNLKYHNYDKDNAYIIKSKILPRNIKLLKNYNLLELLK